MVHVWVLPTHQQSTRLTAKDYPSIRVGNAQNIAKAIVWWADRPDWLERHGIPYPDRRVRRRADEPAVLAFLNKEQRQDTARVSYKIGLDFESVGVPYADLARWQPREDVLVIVCEA